MGIRIIQVLIYCSIVKKIPVNILANPYMPLSIINGARVTIQSSMSDSSGKF